MVLGTKFQIIRDLEDYPLRGVFKGYWVKRRILMAIYYLMRESTNVNQGFRMNWLRISGYWGKKGPFGTFWNCCSGRRFLGRIGFTRRI